MLEPQANGSHKCSNIFYYRKKQNYEIVKDDNIIELKYDRNILIGTKNECSKNHVMCEKYVKFFNFTENDDESYFAFINLFTLLDRSIEEDDHELLLYMVGNFGNNIHISDNTIENSLYSSVILKDYVLLYLYFSNYPYLFGVLTDEEIDEIISSFKPGITPMELAQKIIRGFHTLIKIVDSLCEKINKGLSILNEKEQLKTLQRILIEIPCSSEQISQGVDFYEFSKYYQIKHYIRDIDFCLGRFIMYVLNTFCNYPFKYELTHPYINKEMRFMYYGLYTQHFKKDNDEKNETEEIKNFNKAIKYKDTIVIGDKDFHNLIMKMNLPCENINYLNYNEIESFYQKPSNQNIKKTKYRKSKYFVIMNEKKGIEYIETIKFICNIFFLKIIVIIYVQNKNIKIDKKILQTPIMPIVLTYSEKDILNYYNDNYDRLKELKIKNIDEFKIMEKLIINNFKFPKINETKIIREEDNGWELINNIDDNLFNIVKITNILGFMSNDGFIVDMYKVYKENTVLILIEWHPILRGK